ncbi:hypothetical protein LTR84_008040 [Exophiala bonariae]|uniref:Clr5 domain-containing protein n=1 Tax=Exophiala bonariae TaxID=1690606 RepID=A0AAV9NLT1_9EURO|nr:hypothetical protein LTR84_008040 [Exophiala bonariae]
MRSELSSIPYTPDRPINAPRIKPQLWAQFRAKITLLRTQGYTNDKIRAELKKDPEAIKLSFDPSTGQLNGQLDKWGLVIRQQKSVVRVGQAVVTDDGLIFQKSDAEHSEDPIGQKVAAEHKSLSEHDEDACGQKRVSTKANLPSHRDQRGAAEQPAATAIKNSKRAGEGDINSSIGRFLDNDHNRDTTTRQASLFLETPPLDFNDTSSSGGEFLKHGIKTPDTSISPLVSMTQYDQYLDGESGLEEFITARIMRTFTRNLHSLSPTHPNVITISTCRAVNEAAEFLAAVGIFRDAFNLFHLEYISWLKHLKRLGPPDLGIVGGMATAAINCARTYLASRSLGDHRQMLVRQVLSEVIEELTRRNLGSSLDCVLLHFYLSSTCDRMEDSAIYDLSVKHQVIGLRMIFDLWGTSFKIIAKDNRDRERFFMTSAVEASLTTKASELVSCNVNFSACSLWLSRNSIQPSDRERLVGHVRDFLRLCQAHIFANSDQVDQAIGHLPGAGDNRTKEFAGWLLYCYITPELLLKTVPLDWKFVQWANQTDELPFSSVLALAIIASSFPNILSGMLTDTSISGMWMRAVDTSISGMWMRAINSLLQSSFAYGMIADAYLLRLTSLNGGNAGDVPAGLTTSALMTSILKYHLHKMVGAQQSKSPLQTTEVLRQTCNFYRSLETLPRPSAQPAAPPPRPPPSPSLQSELSVSKSSQPSVVISLRSSVNTIRSSMSFDQRQMIELKLRLRQGLSQVTRRSKDSWFSTRSSHQSRDEDSFEKVTGMPYMDLSAIPGERRDTLMTERIEEEQSDVEMQD